jgi:hypothetical protein
MDNQDLNDSEDVTPATCCAPSELTSCCATEAKDACCGAPQAAAGPASPPKSCGCR